jgi:precorrin-6B methylase 2
MYRGSGSISELMNLFARLETALAAIETRRSAEISAAADDRARLQRIEVAASEAVRALDQLIGQE